MGTRIHNDMVVLSFCGALDVYTLPTVNRLLDAQRHMTGVVVIDLTNVTLIDSSGFTAIEKHRERAYRATGQRLGVVCPQPHLRRAFAIVGLGSRVVFGRDLSDFVHMVGLPTNHRQLGSSQGTTTRQEQFHE